MAKDINIEILFENFQYMSSQLCRSPYNFLLNVVRNEFLTSIHDRKKKEYVM